MKDTIIYVRVSTEDQANNGVSLENQIDKCKQYCQLHGLEPFRIISDAGKSGKNLSREGIQEIIQLCKSKNIKSVVVYKLDRLTRSLRDLLNLIDIFKENAIGLHSIHENLDTSSPMGKFFIHMIGAISQLERDTISQRTKDALAKRKEQGIYLGQVPFGYKRTPEGKLEIDEDEWRILDYATKCRNHYKMSYREIARVLNRERMKTKFGKMFSPLTVMRMLKAGEVLK